MIIDINYYVHLYVLCIPEYLTTVLYYHQHYDYNISVVHFAIGIVL